MRRSSPCFLLIPLLLLAAGCSKPRLIYDVDPSFRTTRFQTVAPDPRKDLVLIRDGLRPLNPDLHLKAALAELAMRSYQPAPATEADLWVAVYVLVGGPQNEGQKGPARASHGEGAGGGHRGGGRGGAGGGGKEGARSPGSTGEPRGTFTVIVQLQDRKSGQSVWHGEANLNHQDKGSDGGPLSIEEAVHQLLRPLPSRP